MIDNIVEKKINPINNHSHIRTIIRFYKRRIIYVLD